QAAGRPLFRNAFTRGAADGSPVFNPFDLSFKNVANTGVLLWAGKLYALWEGGLPHVMDPRSLETLGETRMGGALRGSTFGGHYKVIEEADGSRRLVGFSTASGFGGSSITFYEFAEDGSLLHEVVHPLQGVSLAFIHDITVSEHYYIFVLSAMDFDAAKFATSYLLSQCSVAECLAFNPSKPSRVVLVPRPGRPSGRVLQPKVLETTPCFAFHLSNAFEVERDPQPGKQLQRRAAPLVVVDTVAWQEVSFSNSQYTYGPEYYWGRCDVRNADCGKPSRAAKQLPRWRRYQLRREEAAVNWLIVGVCFVIPVGLTPVLHASPRSLARLPPCQAVPVPTWSEWCVTPMPALPRATS
ncbi:hypothetical protein Vretifemale_15228, partial [Volvox reticuliferus]